MRRILAFALLFATVAVFLAPGRKGHRPPPAAPASPQHPTAARPAATFTPVPSPDPAFAGLGLGFVVWESNRTGHWRIWTRRLDGSTPHALSPDEQGREHCCPHVSPDGALVAYLSLPSPWNRYADGGDAGPLHVVAPDGAADRVVVANALTYGEDRAVVWRSPTALAFIDAGHRTVLLDLATAQTTVLVADARGQEGWLVNASLTSATNGWPTFSPYDASHLAVAEQTRLGGCQPYYSHDGRFGFWVAGAGGPVDRIDLATRRISKVIDKSDPRLPRDRGYVYFPMFARDGSLFACAASADQHDHFRADYDVFVAESDPRTLELVGPAVRVTDDPATDRYPDVFAEPLALGRRRGPRPLTLRLATDATPGAWQWDFGDGTRAVSSTGEHTYARAGTYAVEARLEGAVRTGRVTVDEPHPPRVAGTTLRGERDLIVTFEEPVRLDRATLALESRRPLAGWKPGADGKSLAVTLAAPLREADVLLLAGVTGDSPEPLAMAPARLPIEPPRWPTSRRGLAFLWEDATEPNLVGDAACTVAAHGLARLDRNRAMSPAGGSFTASDADATRLTEALRRTNEVTLEATLAPATLEQTGTVLALAAHPRDRSFAIEQRGRRLVLVLRTGLTDKSGSAVTLGDLEAARPVHVVVSYSPGQLRAWLDGAAARAVEAVQGDFWLWRPRPLVFGAEADGSSSWRGSLEGVAIYDRPLAPEEAEEDARRVAARLRARPPVPRLEVEATLRAASRIPALREITPYREALVVFEWEVARVSAGAGAGPGPGPGPGARVRVAHWAILDGHELGVARTPPGTASHLVLEPFEQHPEVESIYISNTLPDISSTLPDEPPRPLYFDASP